MMRPSFQRKVILDDGILVEANGILNTSNRGLFLDTTTPNTSTIRTKRDCTRSTMAILSPEIYLARLEKGVLLSLTPNAEIVRGSLVSSYLVREFGLLHSVLPFLTFPPIPFLLIVSDTTLTSVLETKPKTFDTLHRYATMTTTTTTTTPLIRPTSLL
jgi:hypothetical protein